MLLNLQRGAVILLEIDDFDICYEFAEMLDGVELDSDSFCPLFVFIIDWAASRGYLGDALSQHEPFNNALKKLHQGNMPFSDFVYGLLDSKLTLDCFSESVSSFIKDYIRHDEYSEDIRKSYGISNVWFLPDNFSGSERLYGYIDAAMNNYIENKKHHPKLALFDDPREVEKYRNEYLEHEKNIE